MMHLIRKRTWWKRNCRGGLYLKNFLDKIPISKYDNRTDKEKGNEKEEYIIRLPREKHSLAERCFVG